MGDLVRRWRQPLFVVLAVAAYALIGARWVLEYRRALPMDIDEAGYQNIALLDFRALHDGGVSAWGDSLLSPSVYAPLMTATTSVGYELFGVHRLLGLLVALGFGCIALLASYGLGRAVGGSGAGWLALAFVAAAPVVIAYSRSFNFAIAAAAGAAVTLWALARSDGWRSPAWSALAGAGLGGLVLARTMTVALVPSLVMAAVVAVAIGPDRLRRTGNVLLSGVVALVLAGPWYYHNGQAVFEYLTSFGYGGRLAEYGTEESVLSVQSWRSTLEYTLVSNVGLPLTALTMVGLVLLAGVALRDPGRGVSGRHGARTLRCLRHPLLPSLLFAVWGVLMLTSTGNKGSGFLAPLVPAFAALFGAAVVRLPGRVRWSLTAAMLAVLALNTAAAFAPGNPLGEKRVVVLEPLPPATLVDGSGTIQLYITDGLQVPPEDPTDPMSRPRQHAWVVANQRLAATVDPERMTVFAFRHRLLNANSVGFERLAAGGTPLPLLTISPLDVPDEAHMAAWLTTGAAAPACDLLMSPGANLEFTPLVDIGALRQAARTAGFAPTDQTWHLPDRRVVTRWHRASDACA